MPFEIKAVYSVAELARAARIDARRMRALLLKQRVPLHQIGPRCAAVLLTDIKGRFPILWESLLDQRIENPGG